MLLGQPHGTNNSHRPESKAWSVKSWVSEEINDDTDDEDGNCGIPHVVLVTGSPPSQSASALEGVHCPGLRCVEEPEHPAASIKDLPVELVVYLTGYLPAHDALRSLPSTCAAWSRILKSHSALLCYTKMSGLHVMGGASPLLASSGLRGASPQTAPFTLSGTGKNSEWQSNLPPLPERRVHNAMTTLQRRVYVVGGRNGSVRLSTVAVFDPTTSTKWEDAPSMSCPRSGCACVAVEDSLWVFGGTDGATDVGAVSVLDTAAGVWRDDVVPEMPHAASEIAAVKCGDKIFVVGGRQRDRKALNVVRCLDLKRRQWTLCSPMSAARAAPAIAAVGETLWVAGGSNQSCAPLGSSESLVLNDGTDGTNASWVQGPPMSTPRSNPAGVVHNGRFHVVGGFCFGPLSTVESLSTSTRRWEVEKSLPSKLEAPRAVVWE